MRFANAGADHLRPADIAAMTPATIQGDATGRDVSTTVGWNDK